jgi:cell division septation protein DedD
MRYCLIFILSLLLFSVSSCHYFREKGLFLSKEKALAIIKASQDTNSLKTPSDSMNFKKGNEKVSDQTTDVNKISQNNRSEYCIIIGTFKSLNNAEELTKKFQKQGYKAKIIKLKNNSNSFLVAIASYESYNKASEQLTVIKSKVKKDAWIYSYSH